VPVGDAVEIPAPRLGQPDGRQSQVPGGHERDDPRERHREPEVAHALPAEQVPEQAEQAHVRVPGPQAAAVQAALAVDDGGRERAAGRRLAVLAPQNVIVEHVLLALGVEEPVLVDADQPAGVLPQVHDGP
jgi:hypothetical protein